MELKSTATITEKRILGTQSAPACTPLLRVETRIFKVSLGNYIFHAPNYAMGTVVTVGFEGATGFGFCICASTSLRSP